MIVLFLMTERLTGHGGWKLQTVVVESGHQCGLLSHRLHLILRQINQIYASVLNSDIFIRFHVRLFANKRI